MIKDFTLLNKNAFRYKNDPCLVGDSHIEGLLNQAKQAPNGRARLLLHEDETSSLHEMVIALPATSFDRPHINFKSGKSFVALRGIFVVVLFLEEGGVAHLEVLSNDSVGNRLLRLNKPMWHTIVPLEGPCVFLETIIGPFEGNKFAPFSPSVTDESDFSRFANETRSYIYKYVTEKYNFNSKMGKN